jgi:mRNA interferase RelE/StbE
MVYSIELKPKFLKQLKKLDKKQAERIIDKIYLLKFDPYPPASKQLKGRDDRSMRVGDYRILYDVYQDKLVVLILTVGHRREVYK